MEGTMPIEFLSGFVPKVYLQSSREFVKLMQSMFFASELRHLCRLLCGVGCLALEVRRLVFFMSHWLRPCWAVSQQASSCFTSCYCRPFTLFSMVTEHTNSMKVWRPPCTLGFCATQKKKDAILTIPLVFRSTLPLHFLLWLSLLRFFVFAQK